MKNILIVEDRITCKLPNPILEIIQDMGNIQIKTCMNAALEYMKENNIDGIILDLGFCSSDIKDDYEEKMGLRFLKELHKLDINIPSILIYSCTFLTQEEINEFKEIKGVMEFFDFRIIGDFIYNC